MLIPFSELFPKYNIKPSGLLHLGAHLGEEASAYAELEIPRVIWVEANPALQRPLLRHVSRYGHHVVQAAVWHTHGEHVTFHVTNNGMSSSLLDLDKHLHWVKDVWVDHDIQVMTTTVDKLHEQYDWTNLDFLNMDLQGAELDVLKGATEYLTNVKWIYSEVNEAHLYKDCGLVDEMDTFLADFTRVETHMTPHEWGDALYIRKAFMP